MEWFENLVGKAGWNIEKEQERCQSYLDAKIRLEKRNVEAIHYVFVTREYFSGTEEKHKLRQ